MHSEKYSFDLQWILMILLYNFYLFFGSIKKKIQKENIKNQNSFDSISKLYVFFCISLNANCIFHIKLIVEWAILFVNKKR